jgi:putative aldouronate transport system permease protein
LNTVVAAIMTGLVIVTLYPFINVIAVSLNSAIDSVRGGITIWPRAFTLYNYIHILSNDEIYLSTLMSMARTVLGTLLSLAMSIPLAYILSKREFVFRRQLTFFMMLTLYFSGGIIPTYFLYRSLGLINSFAVYVIPGLISAWNVVVIRSYIEGLPDSLQESAKIDGANDLLILVKIIFPLITPVTATIALFCAVNQWNSWFDTYIFASGVQRLSTLQYELMKILSSASMSLRSATYESKSTALSAVSIMPASVRATMTVVATIPILVFYPFLQKYFVTGLTLGGVKE